MNDKRFSEQYSEQEAQERFQKLLRSALTTPPKPLKTMSSKRAGETKGRS